VCRVHRRRDLRPSDVIEVRAWGRTVGAVTLDPASEFYAFEYAPAWLRTGIELAPLRMPAQRGVFEFPELAQRTFYRLPALLADALPDNFGNGPREPDTVAQGVRSEMITPLDRLAYAGTVRWGRWSSRANGSPSEDRPSFRWPTSWSPRDRPCAGVSGDDQIQSALAELISVGTSAGGHGPKP